MPKLCKHQSSFPTRYFYSGSISRHIPHGHQEPKGGAAGPQPHTLHPGRRRHERTVWKGDQITRQNGEGNIRAESSREPRYEWAQVTENIESIVTSDFKNAGFSTGTA